MSSRLATCHCSVEIDIDSSDTAMPQFSHYGVISVTYWHRSLGIRNFDSHAAAVIQFLLLIQTATKYVVAVGNAGDIVFAHVAVSMSKRPSSQRVRPLWLRSLSGNFQLRRLHVVSIGLA